MRHTDNEVQFEATGSTVVKTRKDNPVVAVWGEYRISGQDYWNMNANNAHCDTFTNGHMGLSKNMIELYAIGYYYDTTDY